MSDNNNIRFDDDDEFLTIGDITQRFAQRTDLTWAQKAQVAEATMALFEDLRQMCRLAHYVQQKTGAEVQVMGVEIDEDGEVEITNMPTADADAEDAAIARCREVLGE